MGGRDYNCDALPHPFVQNLSKYRQLALSNQRVKSGVHDFFIDNDGE